MPTYEYKCLDCGEKFEIFTTISKKEEGLNLKCPKCGSENVGEQFGGFVVIHKTGQIVSSGGSCCSGNLSD